jgi:hypothetical protein
MHLSWLSLELFHWPGFGIYTKFFNSLGEIYEYERILRSARSKFLSWCLLEVLKVITLELCLISRNLGTSVLNTGILFKEIWKRVQVGL